MINSKTTFPGLPARERPRRHPQSRRHPARRRSLERRVRSRRAQHQGHDGDSASVRAPAVRRRPRSAFPHADRRGLEPERRRGRRDRHRGRLDQARRRRHRETGKPVTGFGIELHGDHDTILRASKVAKEYLQWATELRKEDCPISDLWVSTKCGESDTTSGCGSNPTVGSAYDKLEPLGVTMCFGETTELTGGRAGRCRPLRDAPSARAVHEDVQPLPGSDRAAQDRRPVRFAADQRQHRGRPDDDRGESARQHPEDRQEVQGHRRARQSRDADAARACGSWIRRRPRPRW